MNFKKLLTPMIAALAATCVTAIAIADEYDEGQIKITRDALKGKKVGFVPLSLGFDLPQAWNEGLQQDAAKWGYQVIVRDPNWNVQVGAQALNQLIADKPDVLIFHPLEMQAYAKLVKKAMDAGINVIQVNLKSDQRRRCLCRRQLVRNRRGSRQAARQSVWRRQRQERQGRDRSGRPDDRDKPDRHTRIRG